MLHRLVEDADVFVEGFRPGVVSRLGCDYETLAEINRKLVYCSLSGYGQDGPYSDLVGHDINYISVGGALGVVGASEGPPIIPYNIIADYAGGGFHAAMAILAALMARQHTGLGQYVDIAMSDGVAYMLASLMSEYFATGAVPTRGEMGLNGGAPYYNVYRCMDGGYISVGCIEPWFWSALCQALGREDLIGGQFEPDRAAYVRSELECVFSTKDRDDWWELLSGRPNIAVAKVSSLDEVVVDIQNVHRKMVVDVGEVDGQPVKQVGIGPKLSETPGSIRSLGATVGQHTEEVLSELGYSCEAIAASARVRGGGVESSVFPQLVLYVHAERPERRGKHGVVPDQNDEVDDSGGANEMFDSLEGAICEVAITYKFFGGLGEHAFFGRKAHRGATGLNGCNNCWSDSDSPGDRLMVEPLVLALGLLRHG